MTPWPKIARRIRVPLGFLFAVIYFWLAHPTRQSLALGLLGIVPGLLLRALASGHVHKNEALAITGPYAYTRNPLYLGSLLIGLGFAAAARSWGVAAGLLLMFLAIYLPVIRDEEAFLRQKFPEFDGYARAVPRLLPAIPQAGSNESSPANGSNHPAFSLDLYLKHAEYNALIGALAMLAGLLLKMLFFRS